MQQGKKFARLTLVIMFLALVAMAPQVAAAQGKDKHNWDNLKRLAHNQQIQMVLTDAKTYRGEFQSFSGEAIVVRVASGVQTFARNDVLRISARGKRHSKRNVLIGTAVGFGVGMAAGAAICASDSCSSGAELSILGLVGAPLGALAGYVAPTGGWHDIYRAR